MRDEPDQRVTAGAQADLLKQQIDHQAAIRRQKAEEARLAEIADRERVEREMAELARRHAEEDKRAAAAKQAKIDAAKRIAEATEAARVAAIEQREALLHRHHAKSSPSRHNPGAAAEEKGEADGEGHHESVDPQSTSPVRHGHPAAEAAGRSRRRSSTHEHEHGHGHGPVRRTPVEQAPRPPPSRQTTPLVPRPPSGPPPPRSRRGSRLPRPSRGGGDPVGADSAQQPRASESQRGGNGGLGATQPLLAVSHADLSQLLASQMGALPKPETVEEKTAREEQACVGPSL